MQIFLWVRRGSRTGGMEEAQSNIQGQGRGEKGGHIGPMSCTTRPIPTQIRAWKKAMLGGAVKVFVWNGTNPKKATKALLLGSTSRWTS